VNSQLNTLPTTLYVFLTDQVLPDLGVSRGRRPGRKPALTDAELLGLAVAQQLLGYSSESRWIRYARTHLRGMFPDIPGQSGFNTRLRAAGPLIAAAITALARNTPSWHEVLRLVDSTPLPCGTSRETVKRSDLAGHAGYGYCASAGGRGADATSPWKWRLCDLNHRASRSFGHATKVASPVPD
jgi:hypothetical protein